MIFPYGETVTVKRAALVDDGYGDPVLDWPNATSTSYEGCAVAQGAKGSEVFADRNAIVSDLIVFMPPGADVLPTDQLEIRGRAYEVVGEPFEWASPFTGITFGLPVYCNRVEG